MERHRLLALFLPLAVLVLAVAASRTQDVGAQALSQAGTVEVPAPLPLPPVDVAERWITLEGRAEVRVEPTSWRIAFAIVVEGEVGAACHAEGERRVRELRTGFAEEGIPVETFVEDFIALQPVHRWDLEKREGQELAVERAVGYRLQVNVYLRVSTEETVWRARRIAARLGVTDVLAVDAWSDALDERRVAARAQALAALQAKRRTFEESLFGAPLRVVNVQERTDVHLPSDLYAAVPAGTTQAFEVPWNRNLPRLHAARPQNVTYRGMPPAADVQDPDQPLRPQISVVATVRALFAVPAGG